MVLRCEYRLQWHRATLTQKPFRSTLPLAWDVNARVNNYIGRVQMTLKLLDLWHTTE